MGNSKMAPNIKESELSPMRALASIRNRLEKAVEEGKKKAGVSPKTEAVLEGAGDSDDDYGDDIPLPDFDDNEDNDTGDNVPLPDLDDEGDEGAHEISEPKVSEPKASEPKLSEPRVIKGTMGNVPEVHTAPRRLTKAEKEANEMREFERKRELNREWSYSKAEINSEMRSLFAYADENREYLKDAGQLITKDEFMAIYFAEYRNYANKTGLKESTVKGLEGIPGILSKKLDWLVEQTNIRLHGNGDFLRNGSILDYLMRASQHLNVTKTATAEEGSTLGIRSKDVNNVLSQFVLGSDLDDCYAWLKQRFKDYDVSEKALQGLALDVLTNGTNKPGMDVKLGGRVNLKREYVVPKFGSIERDGDDIIVLGPEGFVSKFASNFEKYMYPEDVTPEGTPVEPITKIGVRKLHGSMYGARYDEKKYLPIINQLSKNPDVPPEDRIIPISFGAGVVSIDQYGAGKGGNRSGGSNNANSGGETEGRGADALLQHRDTNGMSVVDANVSDQMSTDRVAKMMRGEGAKKLAQIAGAEGALAEVNRDNTIEIGDLAKFSAAVLKWVGDAAHLPYEVAEKSGIPYVKFETDKSVPASASKVAELDTDTRALLGALSNFNNMLNVRFSGTADKHADLADIAKMRPFEIQEIAMPDIHIGDLAERCFEALENKYSGEPNGGSANSDPMVLFGKGYLVYSMASLFGLKSNGPSIISNADMYSKYLAQPKMNASQIRNRIIGMSPSDVVNMANRLDSIASDIEVGQESGHAVYGEFYRDNIVPINKLDESGILGAVAFVMGGGADGNAVMKCICDTVEELSGLEPGTLAKYMEKLTTCTDKEGIEAGAREIMNKGNGIIDIHMSDASKQQVKPVANKESPAPKPVTPAPVKKRPMIGRNRF